MSCVSRPLLVYYATNYFLSAAIAGVAGSMTLKFLVGTGEKKKKLDLDVDEDAEE